MMSTVKEIERQIQEAARRKKEEAARKQVMEKTDSVTEALEQRIKLEEEITKKRFDYAKFFSVLFSVIGILIIWLLIYLTIKTTYLKKEDAWKKTVIEQSVLDSTPDFIEKEIFKSRAWKANLARHFSVKTPRSWLVNSEKALDGRDFRRFRLAGVRQDALSLGDRAECFVDFVSNDGENLIFRLEYSNGEFKFLNVKHKEATMADKK